MKSKINMFLLLSLIMISALSAWDLNLQTSFPTHLYDLDTFEDNVWVSGKDGAFAISDNNGETFSFINSPAYDPDNSYYKDLNAIDFYDADHGLVGCEDGLVFYTSDGENWQTVTFTASHFGSDDVESVCYLPSGKMWVAGANGKMAYSADHGANWVSQISTTTSKIYAMTMDESGTGYIVGNNGSPDLAWIIKTTDFGTNWINTGATINGNPSLLEVEVNEGRVIVAGDDGILAYSDDDGLTFTTYDTTGLSNDIRNIAMNGDNGYAVAFHSELLKTTDNWDSYEVVETNFSSNFDGIGFTNDNQLIAAGWYGSIIKSDFDAANWIEMVAPAYYFYGGSIISEDSWYLCGKNDTLIKTEDGGETYQKINTFVLEEDYHDVCFFDENIGILATEDDGKIYRTTDGGANWVEENLSFGSMSAINRIDSQSAYILGDGTIQLTTDTGANWTELDVPHNLLNSFVKSSGEAIFVGEDGEIVIKSATNEFSTYTLGSDNLTDVCFKDESIGVITTDEGDIYTTSTGGTTASDWTLTFDGTDELLGVITDSNNNFIAVGYANNPGNGGTDNAIITSTDDGANWSMIEIEQAAFIPTRLNDIMAYGTQMVAFGAYELVYTHTNTAYGTLSGTVSLASGTADLSEVMIDIDGQVVNPDEAGTFSIELEVGTYQVSANLDGYDTLIIEAVEIMANEITNLSLELIETVLYGTLSGAVTLNSGDGTITEVTITVGELSTTPNEDGDYSILLEEGTYQLLASLDGYDSVTIESIEITADETTTQNIELIETVLYGTLLLTVQIDGGSGSLIEVITTIDGVEYAQTSDGYYSIELAFGEYQLEVSLEDYVTHTETLIIDQEGNNDITVTLVNSIGADDDLVLENRLNGNYPNPFNPTTTIDFSIDTASVNNAELHIYNTKGQLIRAYQVINKTQQVWDGKNQMDKPVTSGLYFYQLVLDGKSFATHKMMLVK